MATGPDGCAYTFGGLLSGGSGDTRPGTCAGSVLRLDPDTGVWGVLHHGAAAGPAPAPRNEAPGAVIGDGFWIFGGSTQAPPARPGGFGDTAWGEGDMSDELWRFDMRLQTWQPVAAAGGPSPAAPRGSARPGTSCTSSGGRARCLAGGSPGALCTHPSIYLK